VVKKAARIKSELEKYERILANDPDLAKLVPLRVVRRGSTDRARVDKVLKSSVCEDTVTLLHENHQRWLQDPAVFWKGPSSFSADSPDPQAQIVGRILQTDPADP
jgi:hypothetical protein